MGVGRNGLERPVLAVDVVVFTIREGRLWVMACPRNLPPFAGAPALPGVAVRIDETLEQAARRALREKAAWTGPAPEGLYLDQLATFDGLYRDPRGRTVSVAYMGIARKAPPESPALRYKQVSDLGDSALPFDHAHIAETAAARLAGKLRYTNIAREFLPDTFRIEALEGVYEAILGRPLNRANFRNKLLKIGLIERDRVLTEAVGRKGGRPPHLYRFTRDLVETADRDFL